MQSKLDKALDCFKIQRFLFYYSVRDRLGTFFKIIPLILNLLLAQKNEVKISKKIKTGI